MKNIGKLNWFLSFSATVAISAFGQIVQATQPPTQSNITPLIDLPANAHSTTISPQPPQASPTEFMISTTLFQGVNSFFSLHNLTVAPTDIAHFNSLDGTSNYIVRVQQHADIWGTLRADPFVNLFLFDPNGITFERGSSVDVSGSFYVSNASQIKFNDPANAFGFNSNGAITQNTLSSSSPTAFGFLGNETSSLIFAGTGNTTSTQVNMNTLQQDQMIELVGTNINMNYTKIAIANGGLSFISNDPAIIPSSDGLDLRILAPTPGKQQDVLLNSQNQYPGDIANNNSPNNFQGNITIANSNINVGGDAEESLIVQGGGNLYADPSTNGTMHSLNIINSTLIADVFGNDGGDSGSNNPNPGITILANDLSLVNSNIQSLTTAGNNNIIDPNSGVVGDITIKAPKFAMTDSSIIGVSTSIEWTQGSSFFIPSASSALNVPVIQATASSDTFFVNDIPNAPYTSSSQARASNININSADVNLQNSTISTNIYVNGSNGNPVTAGTIKITDTNSLKMSASTISSTSGISTQPGFIRSNSGQIFLTSAGDIKIDSGSYLSTSANGGNAGDIAIYAASNFTNGAASPNGNGIGNITINSSSIESNSYTNNVSGGNAGSITIDANRGALNINNTSNSGIATNTDNNGTAGNITLNANAININDPKNGSKTTETISSSSSSTANNAGSAGTITLTASQGDLNLTNTNINTNINGGASGTGAPANITATAIGNVLMDNSGLSSSTIGNSDAGNIRVSTSGALQMLNGSTLKTDSGDTVNPANYNTWGTSQQMPTGNAGSINVDHNKSVSIDSGSYISSSTADKGNAGTITIATDNLSIRGISPIPLDRLGHYVDRNFTGIESVALGSATGQAGSINIDVHGDADLSNGAQISISNQGGPTTPSHTESAASINVTANNFALRNSQMLADSSHYVDAGSINLKLNGGNLKIDPSAISTSANNGDGGNINIFGANQIWLFNSEITTSVNGSSPGLTGGNINIGANYLIMDSGFIQANSSSFGGGGGLVNIYIPFVIASGGSAFVGGSTPYTFQAFSGLNVIQAAAPDGVNGVVNITSPQLNLSGTLANLVIPNFDQVAFTQDMCAIGEGSSLTQTGRGALPRRSDDKLLWIPSSQF